MKYFLLIIASTYLSEYFLKILTIGPIIMAEITVPSRTPAKYPKNIKDNAAAIITKETSQ